MPCAQRRARSSRGRSLSSSGHGPCPKTLHGNLGSSRHAERKSGHTRDSPAGTNASAVATAHASLHSQQQKQGSMLHGTPRAFITTEPPCKHMHSRMHMQTHAHAHVRTRTHAFTLAQHNTTRKCPFLEQSDGVALSAETRAARCDNWSWSVAVGRAMLNNTGGVL